MADTEANDGDNGKSGKEIPPEEVHAMYHNRNMTQAQIGEHYGVTQQYISQILRGYERGRESVDPSDFGKDELKSALGDDPTTDPYDHDCPACGEIIPSPDSAGRHPCPECGTELEWSADEI